jgi:cation diffusion facilitator CzcD-associated flavoprotein CzcO
MAFSDFPNRDLQSYPDGREYLRYLNDYAAHFHLGKHIKYNIEIISAALDEDGKWRIEVQEGPERRVEMADALIVATGGNAAPKGSPPQLDGFSGKTIHSSRYNHEFLREVKEKQLRVLVVGDDYRPYYLGTHHAAQQLLRTAVHRIQ